jgi:hypothetical protein
MASTINGTSTGNGGLISTGDDSGILNIQTNETTAITVDASQNTTFAGKVTSAGALTLASNGTTTALTITTAQNVGIGTTTPLALGNFVSLEVKGSSAGLVAVSSGAGSAFGRMYNAGSSVVLGASTAHPLLFDTNDTERMRIDSSGSVLVGTTTSTTEKIRIFQSAANNVAFFRNSNATTVYGIQIEYSARTPNTTGEEFIYCGDTAPRFTARSNGGIANYSANNVNLSDRREKTNFAPAKAYLDIVCNIPVQTFNYIDQNMETDGGLTLGVVAQDVQAVAPELVMESNWASRDAPEKMRLSIYQTDLQYALMKSIQELKAINDTQAETINALTARIVALETA